MLFFVCFSHSLVQVQVEKIFPSIDDSFNQGMKSFGFGFGFGFGFTVSVSFRSVPSVLRRFLKAIKYQVHTTAWPIIIHSQPISGRFLHTVGYLLR